MSELAQQLADLVQSPGWKWFAQHAEREWGSGGQRFEATVDKFADSRAEDPVVLRQLQQIVVCRREILKLLRAPDEEITRQRSLAREPAGMSRRGAL